MFIQDLISVITLRNHSSTSMSQFFFLLSSNPVFNALSHAKVELGLSIRVVLPSVDVPRQQSFASNLVRWFCARHQLPIEK